jgi:hypothetical protein
LAFCLPVPVKDRPSHARGRISDAFLTTGGQL